jgi:hypothetical protein
MGGILSRQSHESMLFRQVSCLRRCASTACHPQTVLVRPMQSNGDGTRSVPAAKNRRMGRLCCVTDPGQLPGRPLGPRKMLKNGLHRVTALRNHPDASDLRAAQSVVD